MRTLRRPGDAALRAFVAARADVPVFQTAAEIPATPPGYIENQAAARLGFGAACFERARTAIQGWQMFPGNWLTVQPPGVPIEPGRTVAVVARAGGVWSIDCCRIVAVTDEPRLFAFTYATTADHSIGGAERFAVEWRADDSVWYVVRSISRPRSLLIWLAYPLLRHLQKRFLRESPAAMQRAVAERACAISSSAATR